MIFFELTLGCELCELNKSDGSVIQRLRCAGSRACRSHGFVETHFFKIVCIFPLDEVE